MSDIDPQNPSPAADPTPFAPPSPPPGYASPKYPAAQPPAPTQQPYAAPQTPAGQQPYPGQQPYAAPQPPAGQQPWPGQQPYAGQQPGYPPAPAYPQQAAYPPPTGYQPGPYGQAGGYGPGGTAYPAQVTTRPLAPSKVSPIMLLVTSALGVLLSGIVGPPSLVMSIIALMRGSTDPAKAARTTKLGWIVLAVNAVVGIPLIILLIIWLRR